MASTKTEKATKVAEEKTIEAKKEEKKEEKKSAVSDTPRATGSETRIQSRNQPESQKKKKEEEDVEEEDCSEEEFEAPKQNGAFRGPSRPQGRGGSYRGGNSRGRGGNRGRPAHGGYEKRGPRTGENTIVRKPHEIFTFHQVFNHPTKEAWNAFQQGDVLRRFDLAAHYVVSCSPIKVPERRPDQRGPPEKVHPQQHQIKGPICLSVKGHRGGDIYFIRGKTYAISNDMESGRSIVFTTSSNGGKNDPNRLTFAYQNKDGEILRKFDESANGVLKSGQTLVVKIGRFFPNHFYYQDTEESFLGGPVIVQKNFARNPRPSRDDSDSDSDGHQTNY